MWGLLTRDVCPLMRRKKARDKRKCIPGAAAG